MCDEDSSEESVTELGVASKQHPKNVEWLTCICPFSELGPFHIRFRQHAPVNEVSKEVDMSSTLSGCLR